MLIGSHVYEKFQLSSKLQIQLVFCITCDNYERKDYKLKEKRMLAHSRHDQGKTNSSSQQDNEGIKKLITLCYVATSQ